jgi:hypothetical protein
MATKADFELHARLCAAGSLRSSLFCNFDDGFPSRWPGPQNPPAARPQEVIVGCSMNCLRRQIPGLSLAGVELEGSTWPQTIVSAKGDRVWFVTASPVVRFWIRRRPRQVHPQGRPAGSRRRRRWNPAPAIGIIDATGDGVIKKIARNNAVCIKQRPPLPM